MELVSTTYDRSKWERALTAAQEALEAAEEAGYELFSVEAADQIAENDGLGLPYIPGREVDNEENNLF